MSELNSATFASYEQRWLTANPEQRMIAVFLPRVLRARAGAFGTLVHELGHTTFHAHEPQAAAAKLSWWRQELADAALGTPNHPITQTLFADAAARETDPALWLALAEGALAQLDAPGAGTLAALLEQLDPFFGAAARAESALLGDGAGNTEANAALWMFSHLLHELPRLDRPDRQLPLPLNLLARFGLTRADLAQPSPRRNMLVKDFLDELVLETNGALGVASQRTLSLRVRTQLDRRRIAHALRVTDPLDCLQRHPHAGRWATLVTVWREARAALR